MVCYETKLIDRTNYINLQSRKYSKSLFKPTLSINRCRELSICENDSRWVSIFINCLFIESDLKRTLNAVSG